MSEEQPADNNDARKRNLTFEGNECEEAKIDGQTNTKDNENVEKRVANNKVSKLFESSV